MDTRQLNELLECDSKIEAYVKQLPQVRHLSDQKESLQTENKRIANSNIMCQPVLDRQRKVLYGRRDNIEEEVNAIKEVKAEIDTKSGEIYNLIKTECDKLERESDSVADDFLEQRKYKHDVSGFLDAFSKCRKMYHSRTVNLKSLSNKLQERKNETDCMKTQSGSWTRPSTAKLKTENSPSRKYIYNPQNFSLY
jgi:chromosome segregation ATPase